MTPYISIVFFVVVVILIAVFAFMQDSPLSDKVSHSILIVSLVGICVSVALLYQSNPVVAG